MGHLPLTPVEGYRRFKAVAYQAENCEWHSQSLSNNLSKFAVDVCGSLLP